MKRAPTIYGASDNEDGTVEDAPPSAKRRAIEQPTNPPGGNRARTPQSLPKNAGRADKAKALTTPLPAFADKLDVTPTADGQRSDALPHAPAKTDMGPLGPFGQWRNVPDLNDFGRGAAARLHGRGGCGASFARHPR